MRQNQSKRSQVWEKTGGKCWYCGIQLEPFSFPVDHVVPKCKGGDSSVSNLVPCCGQCNGRKGHKSVEQFRRVLMGPRFSKIQIDFIESCGITFAELKPLKPVVFYFETMGDR